MKKDHSLCPYCGEPLAAWEPSPYTEWGNTLYYCANNDCPYFIRGREKVCHEYEKNFAYRYCLDPENGFEVPLVAWCPGELSLLKGRVKENRCL